jgi:hypothetical protein
MKKYVWTDLKNYVLFTSEKLEVHNHLNDLVVAPTVIGTLHPSYIFQLESKYSYQYICSTAVKISIRLVYYFFTRLILIYMQQIQIGTFLPLDLYWFLSINRLRS